MKGRFETWDSFKFLQTVFGIFRNFLELQVLTKREMREIRGGGVKGRSGREKK
jgi:hypothetical protein